MMGAEVSLQYGKGKGDAMLQGIKQLDSRIRYIVFIDADYTYPAEYIPRMINILEHEPAVGMVIGNRFNGEHNFAGSTTNMFYTVNRLLAFAQYLLNDVKLDDPLQDYEKLKLGS
jgi:cellulose synthase/poly-beta-1,6-N-acetylglucosamine synthase-like glycosyltransferase